MNHGTIEIMDQEVKSLIGETILIKISYEEIKAAPTYADTILQFLKTEE